MEPEGGRCQAIRLRGEIIRIDKFNLVPEDLENHFLNPEDGKSWEIKPEEGPLVDARSGGSQVTGKTVALEAQRPPDGYSKFVRGGLPGKSYQGFGTLFT